MSDCPICGVPLSEERPRYCAVLETNGATRSAATGADGDESDTGIRRQLCPDCWEDLYGSLTGRANSRR